MPAQFISKKLTSSRIVWFASSNQWIHLKEPAWYIFTLLRKGQNTQDITLKCSIRYNLSPEESRHFVNDISGNIAELQKPVKTTGDKDLSAETLKYLSFTPFSVTNYRIDNKLISISYDSRLSEYYIHPPLAHLETTGHVSSDAHYEIFSHNNLHILRRKNYPGFFFSSEDFNQLKKKLFIEIANILYNKTNDSWMSFLHASGISNGRETILLSSASGSGKSTMAALLQAKGLQLVSDDFIPLDAVTKRAYPFPAAVSVKKSAFSVLTPFYGNLHDEKYNLYPYAHKSIRYLRPLTSSPPIYKPRPVRSIIFIRYNPGIPYKLDLLDIPEALKLFHEQAWVSHNPDHAKAFINWFLKLKCYRMEYSDNERGIEGVLGRFGEQEV